jgi:hypothetical protein
MLFLFVCTAAATVVAASPAGAHDAVGVANPSSNYRVRVTSVPDVDGLNVRTTDAATNIELTNTSDDEFVVLDYEGQPYLRIGPAGVFENSDSQAAYLNRSPDVATATVPDDVGTGAPRWRHTSDEPVGRWHDHRTHWMTDDPPDVRAEPGSIHEVAEWAIPVRVGAEVMDITGTIEWVPPPSPIPWSAMGALIAIAATALLFRFPRAALIGVSIVTAVSYSTHLAGIWTDSTEPTDEKLAMIAIPVLALALYAAAALIVGRTRRDGAALALGGAATSALLCIAGAGSWLFRSQLPTALEPGIARVAITLIAALSVGTAVWSTTAIVRASTPHRSSEAPLPTRV